MSEYTIKQIFIDNWDSFVYCNPDLDIRPVVFSEVNRMINCKNPDNGYALYYCEHCDKFLSVPFTCKSRFCNSCGVKYAKDRAFAISKKLIRSPHRHIVFTIPQELRIYFLKYRFLLDGLFLSASETVLSWFRELNKSQNFIPGIMCTLHTFGRDLKWNPHIHMLCSEGGAGNSEVFRKIPHISYSALRQRWRKLLLDYLSSHLPQIELCNFRKLKSLLYKAYDYGFYVRAKPTSISSVSLAVEYVIRYTGRPAMAQSRIISYDGDFVSFYYERHEDNVRVEETVHVFDFIKRLIRHIPDKHFNMVRYYGLYAMKHKFSHLLFKMLSAEQINIKNSFRKWRLSILLSFNFDPLICSCGNVMTFVALFIPQKVFVASLSPPLYNCFG